ncbi:hypothetical protein AAFH68_40370 [Flavobacterium sp. CGRL1]
MTINTTIGENKLKKLRNAIWKSNTKKILDEYETIKNKFNCTQCGGNIEIEKIFLIETYISCPYCQTQNTFAPSTLGRNLQNIAKELAEQRTAHLYDAYESEKDKERDLYHKRHELSLSTIHESDKKSFSRNSGKNGRS